MCLYVCVYRCVFIGLCVCMRTCVSVYAQVCLLVCVCVCIRVSHSDTHTHTRADVIGSLSFFTAFRDFVGLEPHSGSVMKMKMMKTMRVVHSFSRVRVLKVGEASGWILRTCSREKQPLRWFVAALLHKLAASTTSFGSPERPNSS